MSDASVAKRGRKPIQVTAGELQECINLVEAAGPLKSRAALWDAVAATPWAQATQPVSLKPQTAMVLAKKYNLTIKTPLGQKGRQKGCGPVPGAGGKRKRMLPETEVALRQTFPLNMVTGYGDGKDKPLKILPKVIDKAVKGSLKAAVKLKCLECTNVQPTEIRYCTCTGCPLWHFRPYKGNVNVTSSGIILADK